MVPYRRICLVDAVREKRKFAGLACDAVVAFNNNDVTKATNKLMLMDDMLREASNRRSVRSAQHQKRQKTDRGKQ
jgi:hypothetical protein